MIFSCGLEACRIDVRDDGIFSVTLYLKFSLPKIYLPLTSVNLWWFFTILIIRDSPWMSLWCHYFLLILIKKKVNICLPACNWSPWINCNQQLSLQLCFRNYKHWYQSIWTPNHTHSHIHTYMQKRTTTLSTHTHQWHTPSNPNLYTHLISFLCQWRLRDRSASQFLIIFKRRIKTRFDNELIIGLCCMNL